jgi:hypothetical protein
MHPGIAHNCLLPPGSWYPHLHHAVADLRITAELTVTADSNVLTPWLQGSLNAFMALGKPAWQEARQTLTRLLSNDEGRLRDDAALRQAAIIPQVNSCWCWMQQLACT